MEYPNNIKRSVLLVYLGSLNAYSWLDSDFTVPHDDLLGLSCLSAGLGSDLLCAICAASSVDVSGSIHKYRLASGPVVCREYKPFHLLNPA